MPTVRWTSPMRRWWSLRKHSRRAKYSRSNAMTLRLTGSAAGIGTMLLKYWDDAAEAPVADVLAVIGQQAIVVVGACDRQRDARTGCRSRLDGGLMPAATLMRAQQPRSR